MIGADQIFHVLTEFRFDIGHAVLSSEHLQNQVEQLSGAADNALLSFQRLSMGIVGQFGIGTGGALGAIMEAVKAADKFGMNQRKLANIFMANGNKIEGGPVSFMKAMQVSSQIMDEIRVKARNFGLPAQALFDTTTQLGATLFSSGHAGRNMEPAIELSRQYLKSAPVLGVDPSMAQGELLSLIQGHGNMNERLAQRLLNETAAFAPFKRGGITGFNAQPEAKRIDILTKALAQFSNTAEVVAGNAHSLSGEMQTLKDQIIGAFSILKPIGDAILKPLTMILDQVNKYLAKQGAQIAKNLGHLFGGLLSDPEGLMVDIMQVKKLKQDVKKASHILEFVGLIEIAGQALKYLGITAALATPGLGEAALALGVLGDFAFMRGSSLMGRMMMIVGGMATLGVALAKFPILLRILGFAVGKLFAPIALLTAIMQLFSRAEAKAQIRDIKMGLDLAPKLTGLVARTKDALSAIFYPVIKLFDYAADMLSHLLDSHAAVTILIPLFELLVRGMEAVGDAVLGVCALFNGALNGLAKGYAAMSEGRWGDIMKEDLQGFKEGIDEFLRTHMHRLESGDAVAQTINNWGGVTIQNNFKEQMEPDRVAFALKDQLMKAAQNRSQSRAKSFAGAFVGGN